MLCSAVGSALCPEQCYSILVLGHSRPVWRANCIAVFAVTEACCQHESQSSTELCGMHVAKSSAAVHWYWVTADLYGEQMFMGVFAVTKACCQHALQSSTEPWTLMLPRAVLQCTGGGSLQTCMKSKYS